MTLKKRASKLKSFKERLQFLIGDTKPYKWCKEVGIEKGLFQYYWQKEKIPKYENLIKIKNHTSCSLDWLMAGDGEPYPDRIEDMDATTNALMSQITGQMDKLEKMVQRLKKIKAETESLKKGR
jgi:hypothetical protein